MEYWDTWVAQSVKCLTLDFRFGHDLMVLEIKPCVGLCADSTEPAWDSLLSLSVSDSLLSVPLVSLSIFLDM